MITDPYISKESIQPAEKPVILVVDDSRVIRLALKKILQKEFIFIEANDGEEAWKALMDDTSIQVVFSDLSMPELDGFGLLERIRSSKEERVCNLPFVVITGNEDDEGILQRALDCGATDLITKPFQSKEIKERAYAFAKYQTTSKAASEIDSGAIDLVNWSEDSSSAQSKALHASKLLAAESESEEARLKKEEDFRKNAADEAAARIKEEVKERRKQLALEEEATNKLKKEQEDAQAEITAEALRKIEMAEQLEIAKVKALEVAERIRVEVEARKKAEEDLAKFREEMEGRKKEDTHQMLDLETDGKVESTHHQAGLDLAKPKSKEKDSVMAFDVRQPDDHIQKAARTTSEIDDRRNKKETEMIRAELKKKLQKEHEVAQHQQTYGFFISIAVVMLTIINFLPGVNLDETIKNFKKPNH